jgi:DeoR/GlpR family transcriptional regulator of sugar metabolism
MEAILTSHERRSRLVEHLHQAESATIEELAVLFSVSKMTIHRDLDRLEEQKIVRKVHGGATLLPSTVFEADRAYRSQLAVSEKAVIARAAAERIERGMAILIDDSSTAAQVVPQILNRRPLKLITNSLSIISDYRYTDGISVTALGGDYDSVCDAFFGIIAEQSISRLRADVALLSVAAIRGASAYFHNPEVARFKLACLAAADHSILMVDHTKFEKSALHMFSHLSTFDEVLTSDLLAPRIVADLREARVKLSVVAMDRAADVDATTAARSTPS